MEARDTERVRAPAHPDISYQNVPFPPTRGLAAFDKQLNQFEGWMTGFEWSLWVCGTFEVRDGKVIVWRDRFDFADATIGAVKGAGRVLLGAARDRLG